MKEDIKKKSKNKYYNSSKDPDPIEELPSDTPFLAKNVDEISDMNPYYSGKSLNNAFNPNNPHFWRRIIIPAVTVVGIAILVSNLTKGTTN